LEDLLEDGEKAKGYREISTVGLQENFSWDKIARQFHELYRQMAEAAPARKAGEEKAP
jgi:glycogen synthase